MKKKIIIIASVVIILLTIIVAITSHKNKLVIDGYNLTLKEKSTFEDLEFKYPKQATIKNISSYITLTYLNDNQDKLFEIGISNYFDPIESSMSSVLKPDGELKNKDLVWKRYIDDKGNHSYTITYNKKNYLISFIYTNKNLDKFEEKFIKSIRFRK